MVQIQSRCFHLAYEWRFSEIIVTQNANFWCVRRERKTRWHMGWGRIGNVMWSFSDFSFIEKAIDRKNISNLYGNNFFLPMNIVKNIGFWPADRNRKNERMLKFFISSKSFHKYKQPKTIEFYCWFLFPLIAPNGIH